MTDHTPAADSVFDQVRVRYAAAALAVTNKKAGGALRHRQHHRQTITTPAPR